MKVYITYDRYGSDEWFQVIQVTDKLSEVKKDYKKNLFDFISYGPDDCHQYQIQVVEMTKDDFDHLKELVEKTNSTEDVDDDSKELHQIMVKISDECDYDDNCLLNTDGLGDNEELVDFWIEHKNLDPDDYDDIQEKMFDDDRTLYDKVLKMYINQNYHI